MPAPSIFVRPALILPCPIGIAFVLQSGHVFLAHEHHRHFCCPWSVSPLFFWLPPYILALVITNFPMIDPCPRCILSLLLSLLSLSRFLSHQQSCGTMGLVSKAIINSINMQRRQEKRKAKKKELSLKTIARQRYQLTYCNPPLMSYLALSNPGRVPSSVRGCHPFFIISRPHQGRIPRRTQCQSRRSEALGWQCPGPCGDGGVLSRESSLR